DELLGVAAHLVVAEHAGGGRCSDHTRNNHVATHLEGRTFGGHRAAEVDHRRLGRRVAGHPGGTEHTADGGDIDDGPAALLLHQLHGGAGAPEGTVHGSGEVGVPVGGGHGVHATPGERHGVVDHHVQATELGSGGLDRADKGFLVADISHPVGGLAAGALNLRHHFLQRLFAATADHHGGAFGSHLECRGGADTRTTTGNEGDLVLHACCHDLLLRGMPNRR